MQPFLPLLGMEERHWGLTKPLAESYLQAAQVSLDKHHQPPQEFSMVDDHAETSVMVNWQEPDERIRRAWNNQDDAARDGAYICALAATEISRGLVAVARAETRTGADYYVAPCGDSGDDLENSYRLEVSGTHQASSKVKSRLREKVQQALDGVSNRPALAAVVGFQARLIMIETVN